MPDYATNAPQGYQGDWRRGAPLGRPSIAPDTRTPAELEAEARQCENHAEAAERDKEDRRTPDSFKEQFWQAAAESFWKKAAELRAMIPAAEARLKASPKVTLRRVRLDPDGYDSEGAYWGISQPLYWAATDDGELDTTLRADDRDDAKAQVREIIPGARFYN